MRGYCGEVRGIVRGYCGEVRECCGAVRGVVVEVDLKLQIKGMLPN